MSSTSTINFRISEICYITHYALSWTDHSHFSITIFLMCMHSVQLSCYLLLAICTAMIWHTCICITSSLVYCMMCN